MIIKWNKSGLELHSLRSLVIGAPEKEATEQEKLSVEQPKALLRLNKIGSTGNQSGRQNEA